jgi:hypothetical protein
MHRLSFATALAVVLGSISAAGCMGDSEPGGRPAGSQAERPSPGRDLRRPLELPLVESGETCPRTPGGRPNPDVARALGPGPAYPILGFEAGKQVVQLSDADLVDGRYWHKTLWAVDPAYDGPVLIRGRGIRPAQSIGFGYDDREVPELELPPQKSNRWRYGPSVTILPGPGCYAFQVDGTSFSEVIVFEAISPKELALEGKPQVGVVRLRGGRSTARFRVRALDPPTHTYDVRVRTRATADIAVSMLTWYGQRLRVLDSIEADRSCHVKRGRADCAFYFPALEAQRPGPWTVMVSKRSGPAVTVRVAVTFEAL